VTPIYRQADRLLLRLLGRGGSWNAVLLVAGLSGLTAYVVFPAVLGQVVDAVLRGSDPSRYVVMAGGLVALVAAADAASELAAASASARATAWLRHRLLRHLLALGPARPAVLTADELTGRLVGNTAEAGRVAPMAAWCAGSFLPSVGGLVLLAIIDPLLIAAFAVSMPVLVYLVRRLLRESSDAATRYLCVQGSIGALLIGALAGARTITAAATQQREVHRILAPLPELRHQGHRMWGIHANIAASRVLSGSLVEVAVLGVGGALLTAHRITPGELIATSQYVLLAAGLPTPLAFLARFSRARAGASRVAEVTAVDPPVHGSRTLGPGTGGQLELRGVTVIGAGRPVLRELDLVVPSGVLLAVVGRSGSGKSTLAAVAGRLLDPDRGEVLLDGVPLHQLSRGALRAAVAYGFDRPVLVGATIRDAVALGRPGTPDSDIVSAAQAAAADGFVRRLPAGYHTPVADAPLSGGEVQRLGLARAFARPARLLILDDATSNLDTVTELQISAVLGQRLGGCTRLVVAHRVATAARADLVAWLDAGRLRQLAPHDELWRDAGYREIFSAGPT
jgi:ATP-binding cassette subfamily B protein